MAALVSIALCTYNGAQFLAEQLDSLVRQDYPSLEIIVVDDGSKDETLTILKSYQIDFPFLKIYENEFNLGYSKNFEKAISLCNGEFIALSDQDDIWELNKISLMVSEIKNHLLIYHNSEFIAQNGSSLGREMTDIRNFYEGDDPKIFLLENCVSGHAMLFKKELVSYFSSFNSACFHDWWIVYMALNNGSIGFLNDCLVKYRQHEDANTNILRLKRPAIKKRNSLQQIEKEYQRIKLFEAYSKNKDQAFVQKLATLMERRMNAYFSFSLAFFIFWHRRNLLFIQKKSGLSKINFILKYAWGVKLKK